MLPSSLFSVKCSVCQAVARESFQVVHRPGRSWKSLAYPKKRRGGDSPMLPPNSLELTGQMRYAPCKKKSKGHAAFVLQLLYGLGGSVGVSERAFKSLLVLLLLPAGSRGQEENFDTRVWLDQQAEQYIERQGWSAADHLLWCDPIPRCESILLESDPDDPRPHTVILTVISGYFTNAQEEFLQSQIESIRASGGDVISVVGFTYDFAVALRVRLLGKPFP